MKEIFVIVFKLRMCESVGRGVRPWHLWKRTGWIPPVDGPRPSHQLRLRHRPRPGPGGRGRLLHGRRRSVLHEGQHRKQARCHQLFRFPEQRRLHEHSASAWLRVQLRVHHDQRRSSGGPERRHPHLWRIFERKFDPDWSGCGHLKGSGTLIYVIGIGSDVQMSELVRVASSPDSQYVIRMSSQADPNVTSGVLLDRLCG